MHHALLSLLICLPSASPGLGDEPKASNPRMEYQSLLKEYEVATDAWNKDFPKATKDDALWIKHYEAWPDWDFAPRFIKFAEANSKDETAAEAALQVLGMNKSSSTVSLRPQLILELWHDFT